MIQRLLIAMLMVGAILFRAPAPAVAGATVFPQGSRIGLVPPPGMSKSRRFSGFEDSDRKVAIAVVELPLQAYDSAEKSIFAGAPASVTMQRREMFPFVDGIGILLSGTVKVDGATLHKWFLLAHAVQGPNSDFVALVTVEVPETARRTYTDKVIRDVLASVSFRPPPLGERVAMLPFRLGELAGFRIMQVIAGGGLIITDGPTNDINRQAYMIVSVGNGSAGTPDDRARAAQQMLTTMPLKDIAVTSTEAMRINNQPGFEIRATAEGPTSDPVKLVQWVRFGVSGYLRIIGVGPLNDWDNLFGRFRAVRDGIQTR